MATNRTETVHWGRTDGKAKIAGVIVCVAGATFMALYKGPALLGDGFSDLHLQGVAVAGKPAPEPFGYLAGLLIDNGIDLWRIGVFCLIGNSLCMALYIVYQVTTLIVYHASLFLSSFIYHFKPLRNISYPVSLWKTLSRGPEGCKIS